MTWLRWVAPPLMVGTCVVLAASCGRSSDVSGTSGGHQGGAGGSEPPPVITDFEPCAEKTSEATLVPVNMLITVDKSGSMDDNMKWDNAEAAFTAFFQDPAAASLNVALRFWPDTGCDGMSCDAAVCAVPEVALAPLSDTAHQQALIDAFAARDPQGNTPMSAALEGAMLWARNTMMDVGPDEKVLVVLVTDGEPNGCNEAIDAIAAVADDGFMTDDIVTFVVGLAGSNEMQVNTIASAGGSTNAYLIGNGNAEADLLAAMLDIAGKAVDCSFVLPEAESADEVIDPNMVRVEYDSAGTTDLVDKVDGSDDCDAGGWYYDDPVDPSTITLCPDTCSEVQSDGTAKMSIALGCECERDVDCPDGTVCEDNHCIPACMKDEDCPTGYICLNGHCVPEPGDPCQVDADCPSGLVCVGGQCTFGGVFVGPEEAVQGGAFSCAIPRDERRGAHALWWLLALSLAGMYRRRRSS